MTPEKFKVVCVQGSTAATHIVKENLDEATADLLVDCLNAEVKAIRKYNHSYYKGVQDTRT